MRRTTDLHAISHILRSALEESENALLDSLKVNRQSDTSDEAKSNESIAVASGELNITWIKKRQAQTALKKIKSGKYGVCETCRRDIAPSRLTAVPWATQCLKCARASEDLGNRLANDSNTFKMAPLDETLDAT
tara:strand:- start:964 stop:1365 length:402 start_codon:yes stop_codon:yes gene_type:complete